MNEAEQALELQAMVLATYLAREGVMDTSAYPIAITIIQECVAYQQMADTGHAQRALWEFAHALSVKESIVERLQKQQRPSRTLG